MKIIKNRRNFILISLIALFWLTFSLALPFRLVGDDPQYFTALHDFHGNLISYLVNVYKTWSSRMIGDGLNVLLVHHVRLWQILEALAFTIISVLPAYFFKNSSKNCAKFLLISFTLSFLFPIGLIYRAGYVATTVHYLFPFACLLLAIFPFIQRLNEKKNPIFLWIISFLAFIYAILEQQTLVILGIFLTSLIIYLFIEKKWIRLPLTYLVFAFLSLIFSLTAPGNHLRTISETKAYFPNFGQLSLFTKANMGFASLTSSLFTNTYLLPLIFLLTVFVLLIKQGKICKSLIILPPIIFSVIIGFDASSLQDLIVSKLDLATNAGTLTRLLLTFLNMNKVNNTGNPVMTSSLADILFLLLIICLFLAIYWLFNSNFKKFLLSFLVLLTGFLSRFMMGFFPSVWMSGARTATFLLYSFMFALLIILYQLNESKNLE